MDMNRETELLHLGDTPHEWEGAVNPPVVHASLFCFQSLQEFIDTREGRKRRLAYARSGNPTTHVLEEKIAFLEQAEDALALASGMAAITTTLLALVEAGDSLLVVSCAYGPVRRFCDTVLRGLGVQTEYFAPQEAADLSSRIRPNTRLIYLESPGSMTFDIQDLRSAAHAAREHGVVTLADNSWATPLYQNPIALGIHLVVHSGTKYIAGHSDLLLGLVAGPKDLMARVRETARLLGGVLSPDDAYLAIRGIRTLPLRMARHHASALRIARWLEKRPEVREVLHPGLESFPGHELARSQMTGYSGLFSFRLQRRDGAARHRFVDSLLSLFYLGYSWGGYESLIVPRMDQDDTYRVSIGLEAPDDLMTALNDALVAWSHG